MLFKLIAKTEDINKLTNNYTITDTGLFKYIYLRNYNSIFDIQELLNKVIMLDRETCTLTVLD